ncbi:b(0,+)-type amino acid transporter 1-like [Octopus sinensis]|uniref:B(0,+)-type amino acid transporter 1-like n=1 Tax=Octopus sinensis TaxID=2607531 RepID=A0A7E6FGU9_9MOLL|nr:b(0,+)-type amino acid transporter 1-like [Octopus sinensis]
MAATTVQLERKLGLLSAVAMIVGTMIGAGIFISPKGVLEASKSVGLTMIIWLGCGVIAMLSSLSYVELGTFTAKSGGEFTYILKGLPAVLAFLCSWCTALIIRPSAFAVSSLVFAEYVASPIFDSCGPPVVFVKCLAALAIIVITAINCYSVELTAGILVVFTVAKITALLIIIIGGFVMLGKGEFYDLPEGFTGSETSGSAIALAFYDGLWAYNGWLWADRVLGVAAIIIPISVAMSTFGATNGICFTSGRLTYAAAREGHLPQVLSYLHIRKKTPVISLIFLAIIALIMIIPGEISSLIDFFSFTAWLFYGLAFLSLIVMRFTKKDEPRPFKVFILVPVVMLIISVYLVVAPIVQNPDLGFLYAFLLIIGGLIFYFIFLHFKVQLPCMEAFTEFIQKFACVAPSKYKPPDHSKDNKL